MHKQNKQSKNKQKHTTATALASQPTHWSENETSIKTFLNKKIKNFDWCTPGVCQGIVNFKCISPATQHPQN